MYVPSHEGTMIGHDLCHAIPLEGGFSTNLQLTLEEDFLNIILLWPLSTSLSPLASTPSPSIIPLASFQCFLVQLDSIKSHAHVFSFENPGLSLAWVC